MQQIMDGLTRSTSIKALVIGLLILILLIPVAMIKSVIYDRIDVHNDARASIMQSWGGEQIITGPVLVFPYRIVHINDYGNSIVERAFVYILPAKLEIDIEANPEIRYRGMHEVPIYGAHLAIHGSFPSPDFAALDPAATDVEWDKAFIALSVSDARAIAHTPLIEVGDTVSRFKSGGQPFLHNTSPPLIAAVDTDLAEYRQGGVLGFEMDMQLNGADSLQVSPLADATIVSMKSSWPSPSFVGDYLPATREVSDAGFTADWRVSSLGRELPAQWTAVSGSRGGELPSLGVNFYQPVSLYQLTLRATKYAILFIGMSFVAYFLFEVLAGLRLHPLQYLLIGFANAVFYLLLLSLAEHIGFALAYIVSAAGSIALITGYSMAVLASRRRSFLMAGILTGLYGFLYMTLQAETYALLAGALGLWLTLAIVMYLTRRIDWYGHG